MIKDGRTLLSHLESQNSPLSVSKPPPIHISIGEPNRPEGHPFQVRNSPVPDPPDRYLTGPYHPDLTSSSAPALLLVKKAFGGRVPGGKRRRRPALARHRKPKPLVRIASVRPGTPGNWRCRKIRPALRACVPREGRPSRRRRFLSALMQSGGGALGPRRE